MHRYFKLYWQFIKINIATTLEYKLDFIVWSVVMLGWAAAVFVFYQMLFAHIDSIAGWSKGQIFILQGVFFLTEAVVWGLFYSNFLRFPEKINKGQLDLELLKPINKQFIVSFQRINIDQVTSLLLAAISISYGFSLLSYTPNLGQFLLAISMLIFSTIFLYSGWFITLCFSFWFDRLEPIVFFFTSFRDFSKYPFAAYQGATKIAVTLIIPIALTTGLPALSLLNQPPIALSIYFAFFSLFTLFVSNKFFNYALKKYSSASS